MARTPKSPRGPRRWLRWSSGVDRSVASLEGHTLTITYADGVYIVRWERPNGEVVERPFTDRETAFRWAHRKAGVHQE